MGVSVRRGPDPSPDPASLASLIEAPLRELVNRAVVAERDLEAACGEIRHVLEGLPYANAQTGKNKRLRRRLERFLSERLDGL